MIENITKNKLPKTFKDYLVVVLKYIQKNSGSVEKDTLKLSRKVNALFDTDLFSNLSSCELEEVDEKILDYISLFELALAYENYFIDNNKQGRFFTPLNVVKEICAKSVLEFELSKKLIDPSCGTGIFPLVFIDEVQKKFKLSKSDLITFVSKNLFFADLDVRALTLARIFIGLRIFGDLLSLEKNQLSLNSICGNSLLDSKNVFRIKFDLIIGNPPYGLSRDNQIEKNELIILKDKYKHFFKAKINKYLAFIYESYLNLKSGGELLFIVPNSWLGVKSGLALRKLLLEEKSLKAIYVYKKPVFKNANVETVTLHIKKMGNIDNVKIISKELPLKMEVVSNYSYRDWKSNQDFMIPTKWSDTASSVFLVLDELSKPLKDFNSIFSPKIALQVYAKNKGEPPQTKEIVKEHSFHNKSKVSENHYPYLEGRDVSRFNIEQEKSYLNFGKHIAEFQSIDRYNSKRIVLREILGAFPYLFKASIISKTAFYNKSCLHINLIDKSKELHLYALCCILNSRLGSFVLHFRGRKSQRRIFPKIVNDDLLNFPYPSLSSKDLDYFKTLYKKLEDKVEDPILNKELDDKVYSVYKVNSYKDAIEGELNEAY